MAQIAVWTMLVPDCIALSLLSAAVLVKKKAIDTCFHMHTVTASTWSHVPRVEKNAYPTTQQAQENVATKKSSRPQLQSCGKSKTKPLT